MPRTTIIKAEREEWWELVMLAIHFQTAVGREDGEGSRAMFMARGSDVLGEPGRSLVGFLDGGGGDGLLSVL